MLTRVEVMSLSAPVVRHGGDPPPHERLDSADRHMHAKTILLVDDDREMEHLVSSWLEVEEADHRLLIAADGLEALSLAGHSPPDLLLLDLGLPGPGGLTILSQLQGQASFEDTPVVVITGSDDPTTHAEARRRGACAVLLKPLRRVDLLPFLGAPAPGRA